MGMAGGGGEILGWKYHCIGKDWMEREKRGGGGDRLRENNDKKKTQNKIWSRIIQISQSDQHFNATF